MPSTKHLAILAAAFNIALLSLAVTTPSFAAGKEKVLYSFCSANNCADGQGPSPVTFDKAGNLYGTTVEGGANISSCAAGWGCGTVFELIPNNGTWTEKVLYNFCSADNCTDGENPAGGVILDGSGNLYGTTCCGGAHGGGTVFELTPDNGQWTYKVLHDFDLKYGASASGLVFDAGGNLYGTTQAGGNHGGGTAFELIPSNGQWTEKVLYNFCGASNCPDGLEPETGVILDTAGNLYGTTPYGGRGNGGVVFELTLNNGKWTYEVLHRLNEKDGYAPSHLMLDAAGNLYGTTFHGGVVGWGTVFELIPNNGQWAFKVLHDFNRKYGGDSASGLIQDNAGNLYGMTLLGGGHSSRGCDGFGCGTAFELVPGNGRWTEKVLHAFSGGRDGGEPEGVLVPDAARNLYGATAEGGPPGCYNNFGCGVVFEITP